MYSLFSRILPVCTDGMRQGVLLLEWKIKTSLFIGRKCYRDVAFVRFVVNIRRFICIVRNKQIRSSISPAGIDLADEM